MKKYLIILILFAFVIVSCEKEEYIAPYTTIEIGVLKQYLSDKELEIYNNLTVGTDTNLIYGYGFKDNKLHIKGFNKHTKQNIWSWISKYNFELGKEVNINKGYGEIETTKVIEYSIPYIHKFDNSFTFLLDNTLDKGDKYQTHIIISGNVEKVNEFTIDSEANYNFIYRIYNWYKDSFILITHDKRTGKATLYCYNTLGNILFEIQNSSFPQWSWGTYFPINLNECILLSPSSGFNLKNIKTDTTIWENKIEEIPNNARIDDIKFEIFDKDVTKLTINYTLYEGDKKVYSVKINNITGEFVQL